MANGQGQGGGRGGGAGDIFSTGPNINTSLGENKDALTENAKAAEEAAAANDKYAASSDKLDRKIDANTDSLNKFGRAAQRSGKETDGLVMKLAKSAREFTRLDSALDGVISKFKPLTILQKRYKMRLDELEQSQSKFNASLFQSTATMEQATARHNKFLLTIKKGQMDAIDIANKYNMSSEATKKISTELTGAFANQIMSYKDQSGVLKGLTEQTLVFSRVMGVDASTSVKFMREQLEYSGRTMDQVRRETWAVVKAADEYTKWLEKMGDEAKRVANINKNDLVDAISKTTKLFNQGKFEVEAYTSIITAYSKEAKKAGRTTQETKRDIADIGKTLDKLMKADLSSAAFMPATITKAVNLARQSGDKELQKRLDYAENMSRQMGQGVTDPRHLRRMQSALRGTTAGTMAVVQALQELPTGVAKEYLLQSGMGDQGAIDVLWNVIKQGGEGSKGIQKALDKRGKDAKSDADEQSKWLKDMTETAQRGHDMMSSEYKVMSEIRAHMQSLDKLLHYTQIGILGAVIAGGIGSIFGLGAKALSFLGAGGAAAGAGGAAGGGGLLARMFGAGGKGAPKAFTNLGARGAGRSAAKLPAHLIARESFKVTAKETAKKGALRAGLGMAGRGAMTAGRVAAGPLGWALLAGELTNELGGRYLKSQISSSKRDLLGKDDNSVMDMLQLAAVSGDESQGMRQFFANIGQDVTRHKDFKASDLEHITRDRKTLAHRKETDVIKATIKVRENTLQGLMGQLRTKEQLTHKEDQLLRARIGYEAWALKLDKNRTERNIEFDRRSEAAQQQRMRKSGAGALGGLGTHLAGKKASVPVMRQMAQELLRSDSGFTNQAGGRDALAQLLSGEADTGTLLGGGAAAASLAGLRAQIEAKGGNWDDFVQIAMTEQKKGSLMGYRRKMLSTVGGMKDKEVGALKTPEDVAKAWVQRFPTDKFGFKSKSLGGVEDIAHDLRQQVEKGQTVRIVPDLGGGGGGEGTPQTLEYDEGNGTMKMRMPGQVLNFYVDTLTGAVMKTAAKERDQHK